MTITRWYPFGEVAALQNRVNSLFRDLNEGQDTVAATGFVPAVDIRVENQTLTVKGERKFEAEEKEQNFHRIERRYGSFFRAFTLPSTVDPEKVQASYNAGVLKLELAKKPEAQPKQIKINVGGSDKVEERELAGVR